MVVDIITSSYGPLLPGCLILSETVKRTCVTSLGVIHRVIIMRGQLDAHFTRQECSSNSDGVMVVDLGNCSR